MFQKTCKHGTSGSGIIPGCLGVPKFAKSSIKRLSQDPDELEGSCLWQNSADKGLSGT